MQYDVTANLALYEWSGVRTVAGKRKKKKTVGKGKEKKKKRCRPHVSICSAYKRTQR